MREELCGEALRLAARGDLLRRAGRGAAAIPHYRRARELARNDPERRFFDRRLRECGGA